VFNFFGSKKSSDLTFFPGGRLSATKIEIDDGYLYFRGRSGEVSLVPLDTITAVSLSSCGAGSSRLVITGEGSELATLPKLPTPWAVSALKWLTKNLNLA